jgi:hypothetical protein
LLFFWVCRKITGYKLYDPANRTIFEINTVKFFEDISVSGENNMHQSINLDENQDVIEMQIEPVIGEMAQGINTSDDLL